MNGIEKPDSLQKLLVFLDELECRKIYYRLERNRSEAIMVRVDVPGERWEVEFFVGGTIEAEIFRSNECGVVAGDAAELQLERLLNENGKTI